MEDLIGDHPRGHRLLEGLEVVVGLFDLPGDILGGGVVENGDRLEDLDFCVLDRVVLFGLHGCKVREYVYYKLLET